MISRRSNKKLAGAYVAKPMLQNMLLLVTNTYIIIISNWKKYIKSVTNCNIYFRDLSYSQDLRLKSSTTKVAFANTQNIYKPSKPITFLFRNTAFIATANYGQKTVIIKWKNRCTGNTC